MMSSSLYSLTLSFPNKQSTNICYSSLSQNNYSKNDVRPANELKTSEILPNSYASQVSSRLLLSRREFTAVAPWGVLAAFSLPTQFANAVEGACEYIESPSGLAFCDQVVGFGPQAAQGQLIKAHYVGKLENGKVFDNSYGRGKPLIFRVGVGEVIKGWDQGILGCEGVPPMLTGGKRRLKIPPVLGYGIRGAGCRGGSCIIPPNSVLFFDVEFVGTA